MSASKPSNVSHETDIFRHTPLRYMGYANEVGEAFRSMVPRSVVYASYAVASVYVLADASSKGLNSLTVTNTAERKSKGSPVVAFTDALVWQSLASVIIPGFTINRICAGATFTLRHIAPKVPIMGRKWISTIIGLLAIPVIIHPIDRSVDFLMDSSIRKVYLCKTSNAK
ncbi:mitochondrial fission process protein 1 isoform X2 [Ciona intestinalis]